MSTFLKYAELKDKIKYLTAQAKELEPEVMAEMKDQEKVKLEIGTFYIATKKKWEYSDKVRETEMRVKVLKKKEEEEGTATFTESKVLNYKSI